jgi:tRNA nucleotidyltransferase (CCA-adding enzyme)
MLEQLFHNQPEPVKQAVYELARRIAAEPPNPQYNSLPPRTLLVGGFVRDFFLGQSSEDIDLEVYGVDPRQLELILVDIFERVGLQGKSFGVFRSNIGEVELNISLPRLESKQGRRHNDFFIHSDPGLNLKQAAERRDFTINSLAVDAVSGELFDFFQGRADLARRTLRVVNADHFREDPLRIYRAMQLVARFDLTVTPETMILLREMVVEGELEYLAPERIKQEFTKLLLAAKPSAGFRLIDELGIIEKYFPELHNLKAVAQEVQWHPEGNVWNHTLLAIDQAAQIIRKVAYLERPELLQVMLATLCHDLGKPMVTKRTGGRWRAHGHEEAGTGPTQSLLGRMGFGPSLTAIVVKCVNEHLKPPQLYQQWEKGQLSELKYANAVRKLLRRLRPASWRVLLACAEADIRGRAFPDASTNPYLPGEMMARVIKDYNLEQESQTSLVNGQDIMIMAEQLGVSIASGPEFGRLIGAIEQRRDSGTITSREQALKLLRQLLLESRS